MKRLLNKAIILALMAATWVSCSQDEAIADFEPAIVQESESDIHINLNLNIPDPIQMTSRNGEIEETIQNITVLCFDKDGLALTELAADITMGEESGTLAVKIPNATRIMHVFANQENIPFAKGMSEYNEDLIGLPATGGKMVYWARIEVPSNLTSSADVKNWWTSEGKTVTLLRNMAKIVVENNNKAEFCLDGYVEVSTNAQGMAVPYYVEDNVYPTNVFDNVYKPEFTVNDWIDTQYVHTYETNVFSDVSENTKFEREGTPIYVYETLKDKKASIIIKGHNMSEPGKTLYWRVEFPDDVRRNHRYTVSIEGHILNGYGSIKEALENDPIGIKPEIEEEVTAIKNSKFSLTVDNTSYVRPNGTESLTFNFQIEKLGNENFNKENLEIRWLNDNQNVSDGFDYIEEYTTSDRNNPLYKATVTVSLKELPSDEDKLEGTILINYADRLERKVKIEVIPLQNFTIESYNGVVVSTLEAGKLKFDLAEWDYTQDSYFMVIDENKPAVPIDRLKFSIPSDFPDALYPFNVLISTNELNVWDCPLIFPGDNRYGDDNGIGFKYVYTITGKQDVYEVILRSIDRNLISDQVYLTIESEYFESVDLNIVYPDYN